jgi:hypothetical protein
MATAAFHSNKMLSTSKLDLSLRKKLKWNIRSIALCGAVTGTLRKVDQKCLEMFGNVVMEKDGD